MGLDMYLFAQKTFYDKESKENQNIKEIAFHITKPFTDNLNHTKVLTEVAYWRKANQVHAWFVRNVQDGDDDCGNYYCSLEQIQELLSLCHQVKDNPAKAAELLPTQEGFFFGSTQYDESYFVDIDNTITQLEKILQHKELLEFEYHSSW